MSASTAALPARSLLPLLLSLVLLALFPTPTFGQVQTPARYEPIANAGSAILADGGFYLFGGITWFAPPTGYNTGSNQLLRVDLTKSFNTNTPPWTSLQFGANFTMIDAVPSRNGTQLILGGNRGNLGTVARIYDVAKNKWAPAPFYPNMGDMTGYKRTNVGMALDRSTGLVYICGGLQEASFSKEIAILDTSVAPADMAWQASTNNTALPAIYEPYVAYLPTVKKTLVFGGCDQITIKGLVGKCISMDRGYLISGPVGGTVKVTPQTLTLGVGGPLPRYTGCKVELPDGSVFIQGGKDVGDHFYNDAWILRPENFTWEKVVIKGNLTQMQRAGHACELGPNGQIIIVGGYIGFDPTPETYVLPYMAVIDTKTWTWTTNFKGAPLSEIWTTLPMPPNGDGNTGSGTNGTDDGTPSSGAPSTGLSSGAKGGIAAVVVIGVLGLGLFLFWKRKQRRGKNGASKNEASALEKTHQSGISSSSLIHVSNNSHHDQHPNNDNDPGYMAGARSQPGYAVPTTAAHSAESPSLAPKTSLASGGLSTIPIYTGHQVDGKTPVEHSVSNPKLGFLTNASFPKAKASTPDDAALAAALFQAEDEVSSPRRSPRQLPGHVMTTFSKQDGSQPTSMAYSPTVSDMRSPHGTVTSSPSLSSSSVSLSSSPATRPSPPPIPRRPSGASPTTTVVTRTLHTPVVSGSMAYEGLDNSGISQSQRQYQNPQSVPEHEARIERSSPGVKTHQFSTRDVDRRGLYPPLTPSRLQGSTSILVGAPASPITSTGASFSAAVAPMTMEGNHSQSSLEGEAAGNSYFGVQLSDVPEGSQGSAPQSPVYRDPQMVKDLSDIQRMIVSQSQAEGKAPHAIVSSRDRRV
ncbi:hypothetical protein BGZ75_009501 [Mortierella antarctica]|nr:hypothetical protein BGZ75_009501 [Mortierella antarctica]